MFGEVVRLILAQTVNEEVDVATFEELRSDPEKMVALDRWAMSSS